MRIKIKTPLMLLLLVAMLCGCKPTEKGYRQAYEAAKNKREQKDPDEDLLTGGHRLLSEEASNWRVIDGDSLQLQHKFLKPIGDAKWPQEGTEPDAGDRLRRKGHLLHNSGKRHICRLAGKRTRYFQA